VQQLVLQAEDLIEKRIRTGKASPTEVVAVLRLGTEMEQAQLERVRAQTEYLHAQRDKAQSEMVREEMFTRAIDAITRYQGGPQEV